MGTLYFDSGGAATNSGSRDTNASLYDITVEGSYAGGVTVPIVETHDLTVLNVSGASQDTTYYADATNANMRIFWITAVDNVASPKTITYSVAPTGLTAGTSVGAIGGRLNATGMPDGVNVLRAGDLGTINTDLSSSGTLGTSRLAGSASAGYVRLKGKAGSRPKLTCTGTAVVLSITHGTWWVENLEIEQQGASGNALTLSGVNSVLYNVKISDAGAVGVAGSSTAGKIIACEISGVATDGILDAVRVIASYIHDCGQDGIEWNAGNFDWGAIGNIIERNAGRGIYENNNFANQNTHQIIMYNTIYRNGNSGLEIDYDVPHFLIVGNIIKDNGNAAGEFNIESVTDLALSSLGLNNCISVAGGLGGSNVSNYTLDTTDITGDPLFVDPDNVTAASRNFGIGASSPCKATGFPGAFLGSTGTVGYMDMGAVQRKSGGGKLVDGGLVS